MSEGVGPESEYSLLRHLGYVAIALAIEATTNRAIRLRNATPERVRQLIAANLDGLLAVLQYNLQQRIYLYRISSQLIPFASHTINEIPWWDEFADRLDRLAGFIAQHGFRVSMHPGQFTVLNSRDPRVVAASIEELRWHVRLLDCLRTDSSHKIVIHGGGAYGKRREAMDRFVGVVSGLPDNWRGRLVLENDERVFTAHEVLELGERAGLPVVFDWLHHWANPGNRDEADVTRLMEQCFDTWRPEDGLPKVHFSSPLCGGRLAQHADWVDPDEFIGFLSSAPERDFDCMLEAKRKDLALLKLRDELKARGLAEKAV